MYQPIKITDKIFYVGVNDRRTHLFENIWPLNKGVSYNSYLIVDEFVALVDTIEIGQVDKFLRKIEHILQDRPIDYLIINHMEPDHGGAIRILFDKYPNIKIVGNKKTFPMVQGYFGINKNFHEVGEGDTLSLGEHNIKFFMAPMVHWPETMLSYDMTDKILFSGDAFGSFGTLDGGVFDDQLGFNFFRFEYCRYYSNIVGKYGSPVQKILEKFACLDVNMICPTHGPVIRQNVDEIVRLYKQWSKYETEEGVVIAYASMYGNTEEMAEVVAQELINQGIKNVRIFDVSKTHASYIIADIFSYRGLILASPTYCNELHPSMEALVSKLEHIGVQNHLLGILGSFTWTGAAVKRLTDFGERMKWEIVGDPVEEKHALKQEKYDACLKLGQDMAAALINARSSSGSGSRTTTSCGDKK